MMLATDRHRDTIEKIAEELRPKSYLEVGVREGESLVRVLQCGSVKRLTLCDTWCKNAGGTGRGSHTHIETLLESVGYGGEVTYLDGKSQVTLPALLERSSGYSSAHRAPRFDLSHVDGGHTYDEALADLRNVWALTAHRMVAHDIEFEPVWKAVITFGKTAEAASARVVFGDWGTICFTREKHT